MKRLHGVVCATVTPMQSNGDIDTDSAKALYRYLADAGIHCLYPNGTNGESLSLSEQERKTIARLAVEHNAGRQTVYIQCGAATVQESYRQVQYAKEIGADGAGLMTPVFFPVDEPAMEQYYAAALEEVADFPIYMYNIPSHTGNDLSPAVLGRLMDRYPSLYGIKYSAADLIRLSAYVHAPQTRLADVLIGCDRLAACCMLSGGVGWVSSPAAIFPKPFVSLYQQYQAGHLEEMKKAQEAISAFSNRLNHIPEIPAVKYVLKKMGIIRCDTVRRPLRPLTETEKQTLDQLMKDL